MNYRISKLALVISLIAGFLFGCCYTQAYAQYGENRKAPHDRSRRHSSRNLVKQFHQLLAEMKDKGYDVSEAEALNRKAKGLNRAGERQKALRVLKEAMAKLEALRSVAVKSAEDFKIDVSPNNKGKESVSVSVAAAKARVIDAFPVDFVNVSEDVLKNFHSLEVNAKNGKLNLEINSPVVVEEYPYSDFRFKQNKAFGSTESGLTKIKLKQLSTKELNVRLERILSIMAQAGVGVARDFQSYDTRRVEIESEKGKYDFSMADYAVDTAAKKNIDFIGRIGIHFGNIKKDGMPDDEAAYIAYVKQTVKRYAGRVKIWQTIKEPMPGKRKRVGNDAGLNPKDVVKILELSYKTIKSVDPCATVYFPGLGAPVKSGGYDNDSYLEEIIALGGAKYFDVIGIDAYIYDLKEQVEKYRKILKKYGYNKPIWVAQIGAPDAKPSRSRFMGGGSHRAQVEFMVKKYAEAFSLGVEKVFWGEFLDKSQAEEKNRGAVSAAWNMTGLFYTGIWKLKPGYFTHRLLATVLDGFSSADRVAPNVVKFTFSARSPIYIIWP